MQRLLKIFSIVLPLLTLFRQAEAQELVFASAVEAKRILSTKDIFVEQMSPFDRAARIKTDRDVSEKEFLEFAGTAGLGWEQHEKKKVESAFGQIQAAVARLSFPLPSRIYFIKTSGAEEGNAAYTRGSAIILPKTILASPDLEIQRLLAHELFHISSRAHPKLDSMLHEGIGFHYCGEVQFPAVIKSRKITNPDASKNDLCIQISVAGESVWAVPILFSRSPRYDTARGGEFFQYLTLALLLVEKPRDGSISRPLSDSNGIRMARLDQVSGFFEQVGRNTQYIIHADEILADNFALLALGERNVPSPEVLTKIQNTLAKYGAATTGASGPKMGAPRR